MWIMLPSLEPFVEHFRCIFTAPSFQTHCAILLGWIMCLGPRTLFRVFLSSAPDKLHDFSRPHGQDTAYNFFERSAWKPSDLSYRLALFVFTKLSLDGVIKLIVDDTLFHKRGIHVWGKGWFRDAVASTKKRVAIASGHNWVVLAVAFEVPFLPIVLALPVMARLHRTDEGTPTCSQLAREMVCELMHHFPERSFLLLGDGGYSNSELLKDLKELGKQLDYIGRMRSDAALYNPTVPEQPASKKGAKPKKGPRLPYPKEIAKRAVPAGQKGEYQWQEVEVCAYGKERLLWACTFIALWPHVLGYRPIRVVIVRDPDGVMDDCTLMCTNLELSLMAIIRNFSLRWAIEVMFKASKQVMDIEDPHHFCQKSVEKVAPWVLGLQTLISVWYLVGGRNEPEAMEIRNLMGDWDTEWSLKNMLRVLRRAILNAAIKGNSGDVDEMRELLEAWKNWAHLAT
jgi:DDE superfamily endonuclease